MADQIRGGGDMDAPLAVNEQDWIFTFGYGHCPNHNYFVRIYGTFDEARDIMVRNFGRKWSMQYPSEEEAGVKEFNLHEYKCHLI